MTKETRPHRDRTAAARGAATMYGRRDRRLPKVLVDRREQPAIRHLNLEPIEKGARQSHERLQKSATEVALGLARQLLFQLQSRLSTKFMLRRTSRDSTHLTPSFCDDVPGGGCVQIGQRLLLSRIRSDGDQSGVRSPSHTALQLLSAAPRMSRRSVERRWLFLETKSCWLVGFWVFILSDY